MSDAIAFVLREDGMECRVAQTGVDALNALRTETYDLVLLDIVLPRMDGWQVLSVLRERETCPPVIALSNLSEEEEQRRALDLGVREFLVKSDISLLDLARRVRGWIDA